jgi:hypothetical protein
MNHGEPILMYHALSAAHTAAFRRWTLAPDRFEAHLDYLSQACRAALRARRSVRRPARHVLTWITPPAHGGRDE